MITNRSRTNAPGGGRTAARCVRQPRSPGSRRRTSEVKDLAQETSRATEDIGRRIAGIQANADAATGAIGRMAEIVTRVNDYQATIASAVEEQTATTAEMARSVSDASSTTKQIADNVGTVAGAAAATTTAVTDAQRSLDELARMSSTLRTVVGQFRY